MSKYDDIINLPHHVSATKTPMSLENRAAQFAPFAALSGHDDAIAETARITSEKPELSMEELGNLSRRLVYAIEQDAEIRITYFEPDALKQGGSYREISGKVKKIDETDSQLILTDHRALPLDSIIAIDSDIYKELEF